MKYLWIFPYYLGWHYGRAIGEMLTNFKNFIFFVYNFFSINILLKTLLSPFQRLTEKYNGGLEIGKFLENFGANLIMRGVGIVVRLFVILMGLLALLVTIFSEIILFICWLVLPGVIIFSVFVSLISLFKII